MIVGAGLRISTAMMAHPRRAEQVAEFARAWPELELAVVFDSNPEQGSTLRTSAAAWSAAAPDATHHLVLQDDVLLGDQFISRVLDAVSAHPHTAICLFAEWGSRSANLVRLAAVGDDGFASVVDPYVPTQGLVLPVDVAAGFVEHARDAAGPDDEVMLAYLHKRGTAAIVTVPNLAEHDDHPSLTGNGFQGLRRSACFVDGVPAPRTRRVAGAGLERVPHLGWMRLVGEWFNADAYAHPGWVGAPLLTGLPESPDVQALHAQFRQHASAAERDSSCEGLSDLSDIVLFELWLTAYALGRLCSSPPVIDLGRDPVVRAALRSALPGAFRRVLAPDAWARLECGGAQLVADAIRCGASDRGEIDRARDSSFERIDSLIDEP